MRQLIIISRIYEYEDYNEFSKFSNNLDDEFIIAFKNDNYLFLIVNGYLMDGNADDVIASKIFNIAIKTGFSSEKNLALAYHHEKNIDLNLKACFRQNNWDNIQVKQFRGGGKNPDTALYKVLHTIGNSLKDSAPVEERLVTDLWSFFFKDPTLESNLTLLHAILSWNSNSPHPPIPPEMSERHRRAYETFLQVCPQGYDNYNPAHRDALKLLRDVLLAEYQT